jgi:hypothetical protein
MAEDPQGFDAHGELTLALEIRPRKFGFAVFRGLTVLLDWGVRSCQIEHESPEATAARKVQQLIGLHRPDVLVMRRRQFLSKRSRKVIVAIMRRIEVEALSSSIRVSIVETKAIEDFFKSHGLRTKHQIATALAEWFDELSWKLPAKRRLWESEPHNAVLFDAVATAMTFMGSNRLGSFDGPSPDV